jgi:hypothetical protein
MRMGVVVDDIVTALDNLNIGTKIERESKAAKEASDVTKAKQDRMLRDLRDYEDSLRAWIQK